jgi:hypothetical protein
LTCPELGAEDLRGAVKSIDIASLRNLGTRYHAPSSTFGLELRVTYALEAAGHGGDRLRRPYYRPAQEPFVWSWWSELQQVPLDPEAMLGLASLLNGKAVAYREKEMFSAGAPGAPGLRYETPERARLWLTDIAAVDAAAGDPVKQALYRFARIIIAHPFTDANGRFARAARQAGLARGGLIATPCLALAPVFYLRRRRHSLCFG